MNKKIKKDINTIISGSFAGIGQKQKEISKYRSMTKISKVFYDNRKN